MPSDRRDDHDLNERRKKRGGTRLDATLKKVVRSKSKLKQTARVIESDSDEDGSSTASSEHITKTQKKSLKKERYSKGIEAACIVIVAIIGRDKKINEDQIDTVLASMLCGTVVMSKSPKGKKALKKATHTDRDFVRMAMTTCKKTKDMGGERDEMECATASVLACRGLRKYHKCKFNEKTISIMSSNIARETLAMRESESESEEEDSDDYESEDDISVPSKSSSIISETHAEKKYRGKKSHRRSKKIEKFKRMKKNGSAKNTSEKNEKSESGTKIEKKYVSNVANTIDYCVFEDPSVGSCDRSLKSISSLDSKLKETSIKQWNENFVEYISYGFAEAINICGANMVTTSDDVKKDVRRSKFKSKILKY